MGEIEAEADQVIHRNALLLPALPGLQSKRNNTRGAGLLTTEVDYHAGPGPAPVEHADVELHAATRIGRHIGAVAQARGVKSEATIGGYVTVAYVDNGTAAGVAGFDYFPAYQILIIATSIDVL